MKLNTLATTFLFAGALMLSGCGSSDTTATTPVETTPSAGTTPSVGTAPSAAVVDSTTITTIDGTVIKVNKTATGFVFEGYENKIVLLEVYGDTCPHCIEAIPSYNALQAKYSDDVVVIALESYGTLTNASQQQYITVPRDNTGSMFPFIRDLIGYSLEGVPYLLILSRDGTIVYNELLANFPMETIDGLIQDYR